MLRDLAEQGGRRLLTAFGVVWGWGSDSGQGCGHTMQSRLPLLGYLGVALLNSCPPDDTDLFWASWRDISVFLRGSP